MKDLLLRCRDVVTSTSSLGKKLRQNACTRAARLFVLIQPIKSVIFGAFVAVAVAIS